MAIPELKDKNVLITGAASGIGRAAALAFVESRRPVSLCHF
ncbi:MULTISPECIES: hypothetical protein [Pseudomonas]|jgi:NAD(P)-dependent dehydrogenase (short-subunit alcohol dehydrogenase family)|nr:MULTISPECIES: hypothetical protein [Pseudomonas]